MQHHPLEFRLEFHPPRLNFVVVICFKDCTPSYLDVVACVAVLLMRKRHHKDFPTQYYAGLKTDVIFGRAIFVISLKTKCLQVVAGLVPLSEGVHDLLLAPMNVKKRRGNTRLGDHCDSVCITLLADCVWFGAFL